MTSFKIDLYTIIKDGNDEHYDSVTFDDVDYIGNCSHCNYELITWHPIKPGSTVGLHVQYMGAEVVIYCKFKLVGSERAITREYYLIPTKKAIIDQVNEYLDSQIKRLQSLSGISDIKMCNTHSIKTTYLSTYIKLWLRDQRRRKAQESINLFEQHFGSILPYEILRLIRGFLGEHSEVPDIPQRDFISYVHNCITNSHKSETLNHGLSIWDPDHIIYSTEHCPFISCKSCIKNDRIKT
jgi:hypothetical protein